MNSIDHAVQFGKNVDRGIREPDKVFPFIYNMIPFSNDNWDSVKSAGSVANLAGIGPTVAANSRVQHYVVLEPDYMFRLLWIKYTVYSRVSDIGRYPIAFYEWEDTPTLSFQEWADYQAQVPISLVRDLQVTVSFQHDGRVLYGGQNLDQVRNLGGANLPLPIVAVQGYQYGQGECKSPYLLPPNTAILFELTNRSATRDYIVGAAIYGVKVRL